MANLTLPSPLLSQFLYSLALIPLLRNLLPLLSTYISLVSHINHFLLIFLIFLLLTHCVLSLSLSLLLCHWWNFQSFLCLSSFSVWVFNCNNWSLFPIFTLYWQYLFYHIIWHIHFHSYFLSKFDTVNTTSWTLSPIFLSISTSAVSLLGYVMAWLWLQSL